MRKRANIGFEKIAQIILAIIALALAIGIIFGFNILDFLRSLPNYGAFLVFKEEVILGFR